MQPYPTLKAVRVFCFALAFLPVLPALALPVLRCEMLQGDRAFVHEVVPAHDPYTYSAFDIRNRFRINAIVIGDAQQIDYVKVYAYYYQHGRPVIAHMSHYPHPAVQADAQQPALTGLQRVYAPPYGFELQYSCVLFEPTPPVAP